MCCLLPCIGVPAWVIAKLTYKSRFCLQSFKTRKIQNLEESFQAGEIEEGQLRQVWDEKEKCSSDILTSPTFVIQNTKYTDRALPPTVIPNTILLKRIKLHFRSKTLSEKYSFATNIRTNKSLDRNMNFMNKPSTDEGSTVRQ